MPEMVKTRGMRPKTSILNKKKERKRERVEREKGMEGMERDHLGGETLNPKP